MLHLSPRRVCHIGALAFLILALPGSAEAQLGGLGKKLKQKAQERIDQKTDEAAEAAVDRADPTSAQNQGRADAADSNGGDVAAVESEVHPRSGYRRRRARHSQGMGELRLHPRPAHPFLY